MAKDDQLILYFAIGSMMNPVSLSNRNLAPIASEPAVLLDYTLKFFGPMGFAEAVPDPGAKNFHGVVHTMSTKDMEVLDDIEGYLYRRQTAKAELYRTNEQVDVTVYCRNVPGEEGIPQERYLDIMIEGARHYGVSDTYIETLQNHPKQPRPSSVSDFLSFGSPPSGKVMTLDEIVPFDGQDGRPVYVTVNGKVLEIIERESHKVGLTLSMRRSGKISYETWFPKLVYDPKYGIHETLENFPSEYSAYIEHMFVERIGQNGALVVAKLRL